MIIWYAQEQHTSCVAACLRMVFSDFGPAPTEKRIRRLLGAAQFGHSLKDAWRQLIAVGMQATLHEDWDLIDLRDCLRDGWYPIVGVERGFFGHNESPHALVLLNVSSQAIQALDPLGTATAEVISPETFARAWCSAGQQALVIQSPFPT